MCYLVSFYLAVESIPNSVQNMFQLLSQAARNMVIQEDAILHSEDVSNPNIAMWNYCFFVMLYVEIKKTEMICVKG